MGSNKFFVALLVMVFACGVAFASVGVKEEGTMLGAATDINFVGSAVTASGAYGGKTITVHSIVIDKHDTTDTTVVTAAESGTTYICMYDTKFQLPAAADGLTYTFSCGGAVEIQIQVDTTPNTIKFVGEGDGTAVDDGIGLYRGMVIETASNTTGTTVTIASDGTDWYVTNMAGPSTSGLHWEDGGAWLALDEGNQ